MDVMEHIPNCVEQQSVGDDSEAYRSQTNGRQVISAIAQHCLSWVMKLT